MARAGASLWVGGLSASESTFSVVILYEYLAAPESKRDEEVIL